MVDHLLGNFKTALELSWRVFGRRLPLIAPLISSEFGHCGGGAKAAFFVAHSRREVPVGTGQFPERTAVAFLTCFLDFAAHLWQVTNAPPLHPIVIQIYCLIIAEPKPKINTNNCYPFIFAPCSFRLFLFIHSPIHRTIHGRLHFAESACGPAGDCFRDSLFPRGILGRPLSLESSREHSLQGIPGSPMGNVAKNTP